MQNWRSSTLSSCSVLMRRGSASRGGARPGRGAGARSRARTTRFDGGAPARRGWQGGQASAGEFESEESEREREREGSGRDRARESGRFYWARGERRGWVGERNDRPSTPSMAVTINGAIRENVGGGRERVWRGSGSGRERGATRTSRRWRGREKRGTRVGPTCKRERGRRVMACVRLGLVGPNGIHG